MPSFTPVRYGLLQRCTATTKCGDCYKKREGMLQRGAINSSSIHEVPPIVHEVLQSRGQPLDAEARAFMEPRFGHDFSQVRIHTDPRAAESAQAVDADAYTVGHHLVFGNRLYSPHSSGGQKLLAHELAHVIQQSQNEKGVASYIHLEPPNSPSEFTAQQTAEQIMSGNGLGGSRSMGRSKSPTLQTQPKGAQSETETRRPTINYRTAERQNKYFSQPNVLGWESKLDTIAGGRFKPWSELWKAGKFDEFADAVADYQIEHGFGKRDIDGVLGLTTWARIGGLGEAMAGIIDVKSHNADTVCTLASKERLERAQKLATGRAFELPDDKDKKTYTIILQTIESRMLDIDREYRGTGAAGAMVYAGLGEFVSEDRIWSGDLKPGAALQVWADRSAFDLLKVGEIEVKGNKRRINSSDANFFGTSMVFVRYDSDEPDKRMLVRHFGGSEWRDRSDFDVWVAANPL